MTICWHVFAFVDCLQSGPPAAFIPGRAVLDKTTASDRSSWIITTGRTIYESMSTQRNESIEPNSRRTFTLVTAREFERQLSALVSCSATVAHVVRWARRMRAPAMCKTRGGP
jgi:hypothetical protein